MYLYIYIYTYIDIYASIYLSIYLAKPQTDMSQTKIRGECLYLEGPHPVNIRSRSSQSRKACFEPGTFENWAKSAPRVGAPPRSEGYTILYYNLIYYDDILYYDIL